MIVYCDDVNVSVSSTDRRLRVLLEDVNYYELYMNNDLTKFLDEMSIDELETYIKKRKDKEDE